LKVIYITTAIVFLFITGILQWNLLEIEWKYFTFFQALHVISALFISFFLIIPFVNIHVYKYKKNINLKKRKNLGAIFLGLILLLITLSGIYLFLFGNRGGDTIGMSSFYIHLYGSFVLIPLLWHHIKYSAAKIERKKADIYMKGFRYSIAASLFFMVFFPTFAHSSTSSCALYLTKDANYIYSANLDGGSITKIDAQSGKKIFEKVLGEDIRRIAFKSDESLYGVTDYMGNRVIFLDADNRVVKEIKTKNRPHAIIHDKKNSSFFVSVFEDGELLVIDDKTLEIKKTIKSLKTPRGLALSDDGRLLVSHSMIGVVSIYDSKSLKLLKTIKLHSTQDKDEFVSQGVPRLLDDIEIKPDGSEAWLPHVLWNFDHPFQFQSTVFPAVSVISLEKGQEKELELNRKHLFKSINILDNINKTMIVSNPLDLAFSGDGAKAFVTLSGSEDIMVFGIERSSGFSKKSRHRKKSKVSGSGAKAVHIFRAYPNNTNPRAILLNPNNNNIYVQNASRLDMTLLDNGGSHPFARVTMLKDSFAKLVENDPLSKEMREGKTLFNNANTNTNKTTPMSGDFWMSCNSCHFEGFNFTNGFLFEDSVYDKSKRANIGHDNIKNFLAKEPLKNYVIIARDTQGGMGADKKANLQLVNPDNMPKELEQKMQSLHSYITSKENLPYLSTWIKTDRGNESYHPEDWTNSAKCKSCHSDIFEQWADSNHKNLVGTNPYYLVLENLAAKTEGEEFRKWCMGCHNPSALTSGVAKTTDTMNKFFDKGAKSLVESLDIHGNKELEEGVSCITCHRIVKVEDTGGNAGYTVDIDNREKYRFEDSDSKLGQWLSHRLINSKPKIHAQSYMKPVYKEPVYCASCHDEFSPALGSKIVSTFKEWQESPFNNPDDSSKHKTCIDCHMTYMKDGKFAPQIGHSTDGGKLKKDVKVHYFAGSNHFLSGLKNKEHEDQTLQLLKTSAKLDVSVEGDEIRVGVTNVGAGHHLPTGVADFRELWLEVSVKDAKGKTLFESGKLKADGNLGEDARVFMKVFGDDEGKKVDLLFWKYTKMLSDTRIPAGKRREEVYKTDVLSKAEYPLHVGVKLNFRVYPQWVTDAVKKSYPQLPNPQVIEIGRVEKKFNGDNK